MMEKPVISFMSLPPEIRNQIYELTILDSTSHEDCYNKNPPLGLLHLNSQVRKEYLEFYFNSNIFHIQVHPGVVTRRLPAPERIPKNQLSLFRGLEPNVLDSLRELMLHVHSSTLLAATFTPRRNDFGAILRTIARAPKLEVLHLNSCGRHPNSLVQLIEHSTAARLFPRLLLLVVHTDRLGYANYVGKKTYAACKDLEWWKHESRSVARCRECGYSHLVEVTWRVMAPRSRGASASEGKQRLCKKVCDPSLLGGAGSREPEGSRGKALLTTAHS